jgi:multicomponent Na+:H+ antiporter subunit D
VGLLTLLVVAQVWARAFWRQREEGWLNALLPKPRVLMNGPVVALALLLFVGGCYAEPVFAFAHDAATILTDPTPYVQAVLG